MARGEHIRMPCVFLKWISKSVQVKVFEVSENFPWDDKIRHWTSTTSNE